MAGVDGDLPRAPGERAPVETVPDAIRILLAEDVALLRGALTGLLDLEPDMEVVAEIETGDAIVREALRHRPDVAVLDVDLPGVDGVTAAAELHERLPECRVLILTGLGRPGDLRRALDAHAHGFVLKDVPPEELATAIRRVAAGEQVVDPQLALVALRQPESPLTPREAQVLRLAAEGADVDDIALALSLTAGTVRNYLASCITKLNARNRIDAVRIAGEFGWV
ncbi:response regulator transcription factor [Actinomadura sp. 7K534]|uniref:response regulator transcription factor n=1 Tax=Actinomadura sp. 7K534 TaxID=2530366 RepID=UPI001046DC2E|nr:response regulator transcription factor [Actinomadura sp. 7K534]TDB93526.1 response regulator transcription factor [Actinomadura sp. 7K534]